jgi:hypothetical protein
MEGGLSRGGEVRARRQAGGRRPVAGKGRVAQVTGSIGGRAREKGEIEEKTDEIRQSTVGRQ